MLELQRKLPKARIVYASATGASEPKNMAYMVRLGLWGQGTSFPEFKDFYEAVETRGVGAMEMVAIEMKLRGVYIARQLSFEGVEFKTDKVTLSNKFIELYNECVDLWVDAKMRFERALELMEDDNHIKKTVWGQFWGSHQRFFKYLCIAAKVKHAVNLARDALKSDKCVVIGLQSTGEAKTVEQLEESGGELTDFVSTAKAVFQSLIEKHFPAPNSKKTARLLGLANNSIFDELGITINKNGTTKVKPMDDVDYFGTSGFSYDHKGSSGSRQPWNISDSEDSDSAMPTGDFSDSTSDDDFESVSGGSDDDFDRMWDEFQNKQTRKAKKRKIPKKKKPRPAQKRVKRARMVQAAKDYKHIGDDCNFLSPENRERCEELRDGLLEALENMSNKLPPNTLDELIDELGGPECVAEMTGRKGRVISDESGSVQYEARTENDVSMDILNVAEKQRFMDGEKNVAIISEAASSGISLHSDRRALNQKRRVHLTIELPWSADRAIQQFGRSHRSNQVRPPQYMFLISDLAGEKRFASIVAQRLQSLVCIVFSRYVTVGDVTRFSQGALSHGDRRAKTDLSEYHIDSRYGREALDIIMKQIVGQSQPAFHTLGVDIPKIDGSSEAFLESCRNALYGVGFVNKLPDGSFILEKDHNSMPKFLNRLLGIQFETQNLLFKFFNDTMSALIKNAKHSGKFKDGIHDISSDVSKVDIRNRQSFIIKISTGSTKVELFEVAVDKGMSWDEAHAKWLSCERPEEGFYLCEPPVSVANAITYVSN